MSNYYQSIQEIEAVVQGFESGTTPDSGFTHPAHVTVAVWYLSRAGVSESLLQMRNSIYHFLDHHHIGHDKYNETLSLFWLRLVRQHMDQLGSVSSPLEITNAVIEFLGNSQLVFDYYSRELLWSDQAKATWVEPDLQPLRVVK
jgi:hypothetical protein